jgi:hypothetical protein
VIRVLWGKIGYSLLKFTSSWWVFMVLTQWGWSISQNRCTQFENCASDLHDDDEEVEEDGVGQHIALRTDLNTTRVDELILENRLVDWVSAIPQRDSGNRLFLIGCECKSAQYLQLQNFETPKKKRRMRLCGLG